MRFSERIGKKKPKCDLQVDSMDDNLRNSLWNILYQGVLVNMKPFSKSEWEMFVLGLWDQFLRRSVDEIPWGMQSRLVKTIKGYFFAVQWYEVYDLLEFVAEECKSHAHTQIFKEVCNDVLEKELSGYRFVGDEIAPITSKAEVSAVNEALETAEKHAITGVNRHLESALEKLSDRKNPDYRNSIKESISSVESVCKVVAGDRKATLVKALQKVKENVALHPRLEKGFSAIYEYTSDAGGIRHALMDESTCDFDDAKYMLVSCSAFVNYLIGKASKAGLIK